MEHPSIELSIPEGINNTNYERCLKDFCNHYSENMQNKTNVYKGIMELLNQLSKDDYR